MDLFSLRKRSMYLEVKDYIYVYVLCFTRIFTIMGWYRNLFNRSSV